MVSGKSLTPGNTEMLLLRLLSEKEMYGYEMITKLREKSNHVFEMKSGTLYPILHTLEKEGCLTSYEKEVLGRTRIFYSLTEKGGRILKSRQKEWQVFSDAVNHVLLDGGAS